MSNSVARFHEAFFRMARGLAFQKRGTHDKRSTRGPVLSPISLHFECLPNRWVPGKADRAAPGRWRDDCRGGDGTLVVWLAPAWFAAAPVPQTCDGYPLRLQPGRLSAVYVSDRSGI